MLIITLSSLFFPYLLILLNIRLHSILHLYGILLYFLKLFKQLNFKLKNQSHQRLIKQTTRPEKDSNDNKPFSLSWCFNANGGWPEGEINLTI